MKIKTTTMQIAVIGGLLLLLSHCTPIDYHYKDYLENADKVYPGRIDSVEFMPGHRRAAIRSLISTDSRVNKMEILWGEGNRYEVDILPEDVANFKEVVIPSIEEGIYTFEIRTVDGDGNRSMRSEIFGRVYGADYVESLNNRIINFISQEDEEVEEEGLIINWYSESADSTLLGVRVSYLKMNGDSAHVFTERSLNKTVLADFEEGTTFRFQTLYKPTSLAIDTFYTASQVVDPADYIAGERMLYGKDNWSIAGFSSENNGDRHGVKNLIDNTAETFWIARFSSPATDYPDHWVTVDMGEQLEVDGFSFAQKNGDRKIREMEIWISNDNENWESLGLFGLADINRDNQFVDLDDRIAFRYFKLVPVSGYDSQRQPGLAEAGTFYYETN